MSAALTAVDTSADPSLSDDPRRRAPLVLRHKDFHGVSEQVSELTEKKAPRLWLLMLGVTVSMLAILGASLFRLVSTGIGVWGLNNSVGWAWDITGFVFWIGIGHAGTLISAILFLFKQKWRTGINRAAEAMTLMAVACALIYPAFHIGRVWMAYYLFPLPNQMTMWVNFRSPLLWDVFAVNTYGTVSALFWYMGLVPDLATIRDRSTTRTRQVVYGILSLGWRGSHRHWVNYETAYMILAGISTPLVLSVHTIVSFDFATSVIPGWHTTIFPPYFVAGAVFSGFGMVMTLLIITRWAYGLENLITMRHLDNMAKIIVATSSLVGYAYLMEFFISYYSGNLNERFHFLNREFGPYFWAGWTMLSCNAIIPQFLWFKKVRHSIPALFVISILVNVGMWFERFVIIVVSLHRNYLTSGWGYFRPSLVDITTFGGTFGLFLTLYLLFIRWLPLIAASEVKGVMPIADPHGHGHFDETHPGPAVAAAAAGHS